MDHIEEKITEHRAFLEWLTKNAYIDYPIVVAFETYALCNATCWFCPYPRLGRTGERMPDSLIRKIIDDLRDIPDDVYFEVSPSGINEMFLDARIFEVLALINERLPRAGVRLISNGSALTERNIERLGHVRNIVKLNVSVNDYRADEYRNLMGLSFERTVANLTALHSATETGAIQFPTVLSRVGDSSRSDREFVLWVHEMFPRFRSDLVARGDFMGYVRLPTRSPPPPDIGCSQWFKLHILPSGKVAFCCLDAEGERGFANAGKRHLLEIYNHPDRRELRISARTRVRLPGCDACTMIV